MATSREAIPEGSFAYIPRVEPPTVEYMRDILWHYYQRKWNVNADTVKAVKDWKNWPLLVRMPDLRHDFGVYIHEGSVQEVKIGTPDSPRIMVIMLSETMMRIYYDESTAAIETIAGRIKIRGDERERRRLLAAISFLTW